MGKKSKLIVQAVYVPRDTAAQLAAIASYNGVSKLRLGGELLAHAVEIMYDEVFNVPEDAEGRERPDIFNEPSPFDTSKKHGKSEPK
jgi:hypothetical protein